MASLKSQNQKSAISDQRSAITSNLKIKNASSMTSICICGAGTMGSGIAQLTSASGFKTILYDSQETAILKAKENITANLKHLVEKKKITDVESVLSQISFTSTITDCIADLIIEAIIESYPAKIELLNQLSSINDASCILASNTSSLSILKIAEKISYPGRIAGMHFFNPPQLMKLVEIVKTRSTDSQTIDTLVSVSSQLGKVAVICEDEPGFIVNRVARHFYLEALKIAEEGNVDFETIDSILEATGFKMGPFKLMDLIGNDINLAVTQSLFESFNKAPRFKPSPLQEQKVKNGELGRKSGKGYYEYKSQQPT